MKWILSLGLFFIGYELVEASQLSFKTKYNQLVKSVDGEDILGDLYIPDSEGLKPAVVVVHGGGWHARSGDMAGICKKLARNGFVVLNARYRLTPEHKYPKAVEDVRDAIRWFSQNAEKFGADKNKIGGWGYSAGAHLILLAGLDPNIGLKAIVSGGTPADLTVWPKSPLVTPFLGVKYVENPKLWSEASPVNHVKEESPPVFLYHAKGDSLVEVEQMYKMQTALTKKKVDVETYEGQHWGHITQYIFGFEAENKSVEFLKRKLSL
jgi:acetyl esterase/lipase